MDLHDGHLSVVQSLLSVNYQILVSAPKTAAGRRHVALDAGTVDALRSHRLRQLKERVLLGLGAPAGDDLVFTTLDGKPLHPCQFGRRFERLVKEAALPSIRLHDVRHTWATLALAAGVHPKVVQERLGHSTISVTLDLYSHVVPGLQAEAAEKVTALVLGS